MSWSLRRRLAATVVVTTAGVLIAMAAVLYVGVRRAAWRQRDQALAARAHALATIAEFERGGYEMAIPPPSPDVPRSYAEVWTPDGDVLVRSPNLGERDLPRGFASKTSIQFRDVALPDGAPGRAVALWFEPRDEDDPHPPPLLLVVAEGNEPIDDVLASVRRVFLWVGLGALVVIAGATAWVLSRGTRPLVRLAAEIEAIDDRTLSARVASERQPTELQVPIRKLNELLGRLEASFAREREFTADVSHELRTPLAALRTVLEVTALADRTTTEYRAALASALAVVQQLGAMVENLLALAQLDADEVSVVETDVPLHQLVAECWSLHAPLAAERAIRFDNRVADHAIVRTDREKLRIVVGNLLANAAEYTERGGWIEVRDGDAVLAVTDSGPPIAAAHLEHVFERLWRGDRARSGNGAHCGLGLALSRSLCARLHLALSAQSGDDGRVTFRIDRAA
ncbi:MAG TPA: ATP-binding protein [Kofleriaceae bacterium]|nr:ATP-binding protein [Kofleriaceae bacterium]